VENNTSANTHEGRKLRMSKNPFKEGNTASEKKKIKWVKSYSRMSIEEAEIRLGVSLRLVGKPITNMIHGKPVLLGRKSILEVKEKVYDALKDYLNVSGYPTEANSDYNEANINDLVAFTIYPILATIKDETTRALYLTREKEIASIDSATSGVEEFVVMDWISVGEKKYVTIVEAKKVFLGEAQKQCFLALRNMRDRNGGGMVYGFVTMGDSWRMISFDGNFTISEKIELLFDSMAKDKGRWMSDYSILIDCLNVALSNGAKHSIAPP